MNLSCTLTSEKNDFRKPSSVIDKNLRLRATPGDYEDLGLNPKTIENWEDARRTAQSKPFFECWIFDGLLDDGTSLTIVFGDNWPYGSHSRKVSVQITPPGLPSIKSNQSFDEPGLFAKDKVQIQIGGNSIQGDLNQYQIIINPKDSHGIGMDLKLSREVPSFRPATGNFAATDKFFSWLVAVPNGSISGTMTLNGTPQPIHGRGYHDHMWGNVSPVDLIENWWLGQSKIGDNVVVASYLMAKGSVGATKLPLYFVSNSQQVIVNDFGLDALQVTQGEEISHPDHDHSRKINSSLIFVSKNGFKATFPVTSQVLISEDLLNDISWPERMIARTIGMKPWLTKFIDKVSLEIPGIGTQMGDGTLEYIELH
jgi:hypothetical protein